MGLHGTFAQCPNVLICTDKGAVSQRLLGEVLSFHTDFFAFSDQGFSSKSRAIVAQLSLSVYLEEFPQWESKRREGLPWGSF